MTSAGVGLCAALQGCVLGTAAGDTLGLPYENLSRDAVRRILREPLEQSLIRGRGLVSDDTEHTLMTMLSLREAGTDAALFQRRLAARLRWWLVAGPPGVGSATARAIIKSWLGFPPRSSGVFSAGNGPSMRAALLGVVFADEPERMRDFVHASTLITHTDPQAFHAALAVAVAAACARHAGPMAPADALRAFQASYARVAPTDDAFVAPSKLIADAIGAGWSLDDFAHALGAAKGVSGYSMQTVPAALFAWMRHGADFRAAVTAIVRCGGDTDSTAAIVGAIVGAGVGAAGIPASWLAKILAWPRSVDWMRRQCEALSVAGSTRAPVTLSSRLRELAWLPWALVRNVATFGVLVHVLLRRTLAVAMRRAG